MRARSVAVVAGIVGGVGWLAKMVVMWTQGGPDLDSVPETIAFLTGLVGVAVAAVATGVHLTRGRGVGARILGGIGVLVVVVLVVGGGQELLTALPGDSWVQAEAIFGLVGLVAVVTSATLIRTPPSSRHRRVNRA